MKYNFDEVIDRTNTNSIKWDGIEQKFGNKNVLPMWIADMDFKCPQPVVDAVVKRAQHGIYGYAYRSERFQKVTVDWARKRHDWNIQKEWVTFSPGVVPALSIMIQAVTKPGDKVIIQNPVYYPFTEVIVNNGRYVENNALKCENGRYTMNFEDLEEKARDSKARLLLLCNPHNPVGRVFTVEELKRLGEICIKNDIIVVADEIHSDIIYKGYKHVPFASISKELADISVTTISPSKTFNLAGLQASAIIIADKKLYDMYENQIKTNRTIHINAFAATAFEAAYEQCEEYLHQMLEYLEDNLEYLVNYIKTRIPDIKVIVPEGTYLVWLDCSRLNMYNEQLEDFFVHKAEVALDSGYWFGEEGSRFMRINIACPRAVLKDGLQRIENAVNAL